jgi:hypothetical protein
VRKQERREEKEEGSHLLPISPASVTDVSALSVHSSGHDML